MVRVVNLLIIGVMVLAAGALFASAAAAQTGSRWTEPTDITQPIETDSAAFPYMVCDSSQHVHLVWSDITDSARFNSVFYMRSDGESWTVPLDVLAGENKFLRLRTIVDSVDNIMHLFWVDQYIGGALYHSQVPLAGADNPRAWSRPLKLADNVGSGSPAMDSSGTLHLVYDVDEDDGTTLTVYHIALADGANWSAPDVVFSTTQTLASTINAAIAIDSRDWLHVGLTTRSQDYGVESEVGYIRSVDGGRSWGDYVIVSDEKSDFSGLSTITPYVFADDIVHLTWHDPRRMHQWSADGGDTWSEPVEIVSLGAAFGGPNALTVDSRGSLYVVTAVASGVFAAEWTGNQWGPSGRIDDRVIDPHGQQIVACQGNRLHVVYYDRTGENKIWYAQTQTEAPVLEPEPTMLESAAVSTAVVPTAVPAATSDSPAQDRLFSEALQTPPADGNQVMPPLFWAIAAAGVLIVFVLAYHRWRF